jgi:hypothetical protein
MHYINRVISSLVDVGDIPFNHILHDFVADFNLFKTVVLLFLKIILLFLKLSHLSLFRILFQLHHIILF